MCIKKHTHTHTHSLSHARTHACTHARTHARPHARTHARTHARSLARLYARTYVRTHAHTYVHHSWAEPRREETVILLTSHTLDEHLAGDGVGRVCALQAALSHLARVEGGLGRGRPAGRTNQERTPSQRSTQERTPDPK